MCRKTVRLAHRHVAMNFDDVMPDHMEQSWKPGEELNSMHAEIMSRPAEMFGMVEARIGPEQRLQQDQITAIQPSRIVSDQIAAGFLVEKRL